MKIKLITTIVVPKYFLKTLKALKFKPFRKGQWICKDANAIQSRNSSANYEIVDVLSGKPVIGFFGADMSKKIECYSSVKYTFRNFCKAAKSGWPAHLEFDISQN